MNLDHLATDLAVWTLQSGLLLGGTALLCRRWPVEPPAWRLALCRAVLALCLVLPWLPPAGGWLGTAAGGLAAGGLSLQIDALAASPSGTGWRLSLGGVFVLVLASGALARLAWLGVGLLRIRAYRRRAALLALPPELEELRRSVGAGAEVRSTTELARPITLGFFRPTVLLPTGLLAEPGAASRSILCHELLHAGRRDGRLLLVEELLRAVLWFQPLLPFLLAELDLAREQTVDREVVRLTGARRTYLEALFALACRPAPPPLTGTAFLNRRHLQERVAHLTREVTMSPLRRFASLLLTAATLATIAVAGLASFPFAQRAVAATTPIAVEGDVVPPKKLHAEAPVYPAAMKEQGKTGVVIVQATITTEGKVTDLLVKGTSGYPELDQAAVDAARGWLFEPATLHGEPVAVFYMLTFNFKLD